MTQTNPLANTVGQWFCQGRQLEQLSPNGRFDFNAADVTTGVRVGFERGVGDSSLSSRPTGATSTPSYDQPADLVGQSASGEPPATGCGVTRAFGRLAGDRAVVAHVAAASRPLAS